MRSKISLVNKEIGKTITRSAGWVSIIYFLGLFITVPLEMIMTLSSEQYRKYVQIKSLFDFNAEIQTILGLAIPVISAVFVFRFLQVRSYSDFIHSLPIKRERIFYHFSLSGCMLLIFPVVLNGLIIFLLYQPLGLADLFAATAIWKWMGTIILFNLLIYMAGVFIGMLTGLSAVQAVLAYIVLLLPAGLLILLAFNLPFYLYGFPDEYVTAGGLESFSPLVALSFLNQRMITQAEIYIYIVLTILLFPASLLVYKHRKLEAVSQALIFPFLKPIFKYGVTFCFMLFGGLYLGRMETDLVWVYAGYLFGALLGYFIAEMVLQKSWRIVIHVKGLLIYACLMALLVVLFQFDFLRYENNIPMAREVEAVHFSDGYYRYMDTEEKPFYLKEPENIDLVTMLHHDIVKNKTVTEKSGKDQAFFVYELKNGKRLVRHYQIEKAKFSQYYKMIYESAEYKRVSNQIFQINAEQIEKITIHPSGPANKKAVIINQSDIQDAVKVLRNEINQASYEEMVDRREPNAYIEFRTGSEENMIHMEWPVTYMKFEEWLEEKGLLNDAKIHPSDVSVAYIVRQDLLSSNLSQGFSYEDLFEEMKKNVNALKVTDKEKLKECLENDLGYFDEKYVIAYQYMDGSTDIKSFDEEYVPDFAKTYFQK